MSRSAPSVILGAHALQSPEFSERGIARYLREHIMALGQSGARIQRIELDPLRPLPASDERWTRSSELCATGAPPDTLPDLFHVMSPVDDFELARLWPSWAQRASVGLVVTLHDLIPLVYPDHYLRGPSAARYMNRLELVRKADAVVAVSESSRQDAIRFLALDPERVVDISADCSAGFVPAPRPVSDLLRELREGIPQLEAAFLLYPGGFDFRKNFAALLESYALLPRALIAAHQLVVTCQIPPVHKRALERRVSELGCVGRVLFTGLVSDADLIKLYQTCRLMVFPSLYEGFGIPILEASRCGAAVIASNTSSMRELVLEEEARFDPTSPMSIAERMRHALVDSGLDARLRQASHERARRFSWNEVARKTCEAYRIAQERRPARRSTRSRPHGLRLGCFSPMPPETSGIADYSARLLHELGERCLIDVFVAKPVRELALPSRPEVRIISSSLFEWCHGQRPYDRILYCMGNSEFHLYQWPYIQRYRGDLLAHELRLSGFFLCLDLARLDGHAAFAALGERVARQYGAATAHAMAAVGGLGDHRVEDLHGVYLAAEMLTKVDRVFVHSALARQIAATEGRADATVLPFGHPPPRPVPPRSGPPIITTFGIVHELKQPALILRAFAQLAGRFPDARLVYAGFSLPGDAQALTALAHDLGVAARVEMTGRLSEAAYRKRLEQATVAVQLRAISNGERSAAAADCLAAGVPTIVSQVGTFDDFPAGAVTRVGSEASAETLAATLADLLLDPERQAHQRELGLAYVAANSFRHCALALWEQLQVSRSGPR